MSTSATSVYNAAGIYDAACDISFLDDSTITTAALAKSSLKGFRSFGSCTATDISPSQSVTERKACQAGVISVVKKTVTESKLEFGIKLEELRAKGLAAMLMGDVTTDRTQAVIASSAADTWAFTAASPSQGADVFYDILQGGVQPYGLTSVALVAASTGNAAFTTSGNLFTKAAHGLVAGQPVRLGTTCGTNLGTSTTFYLVNVTVNTFQLASAAGGTALTGPADVATTTITPQLVDDVSCKIDLELGRVRFLYPMVSTVTATIVAPAIDTFTNPTLLMKQVTPLTKPTQIGWARMVVFDNGAVVGEYGPFKAQITTKGGSGWDATKAAQYDLTISVLEIPGTFGVRNV